MGDEWGGGGGVLIWLQWARMGGTFLVRTRCYVKIVFGRDPLCPLNWSHALILFCMILWLGACDDQRSGMGRRVQLSAWSSHAGRCHVETRHRSRCLCRRHLRRVRRRTTENTRRSGDRIGGCIQHCPSGYISVRRIFETSWIPGWIASWFSERG